MLPGKTNAEPMPAAAPPVSEANSAAPRPRDHPIQLQTRVELVRIAFRELTLGTIASTAAVLGFGLMLWGSGFSGGALWYWVGAMLALAAYRLGLAAAFKRQIEPERFSHWGLQYLVTTTATALGWGLSTWLFPTLESGGPLGIGHVLILAGLSAGSVRLLLPMRKGSISYLVAMMAPLALRLFAMGDLPNIALGACVLVYVVYVASVTLHTHRTFSEALSMRFEREAIAAELTAENARREAREIELSEARERAESASRAKGEFLATISHEIRTPMNGVLGMLRIVRDTSLSGEQRNYLKTASDSAEALLLLLNDVLDFSKIEAGRLDIEHAPFPPATAVKAISDLLLARARDKGLLFDVHLGENLPGVILGDATRLRQILLNLVGNAIKFTERGRVDLTVACIERSTTKAVLHFTVTDTGIGIDSAALQRLFKPFSQADTSMSRKFGGTGLGLAISMRLAQAMGGTLQVHSTLNQGTTFRLILPCSLPDLNATPRNIEAPRFVTPSLKGRVLVVEDDSVNKQVIELFLKKLNVTPKFAPDGEAAISTATSESFDLVLMDCQLPGIDGLEATRRIRAQLGETPLKIVALTANASTHVREACLAAGMNDFLSKPVRFELLAGVLQKHLPSSS